MNKPFLKKSFAQKEESIKAIKRNLLMNIILLPFTIGAIVFIISWLIFIWGVLLLMNYSAIQTMLIVGASVVTYLTAKRFMQIYLFPIEVFEAIIDDYKWLSANK